MAGPLGGLLGDQLAARRDGTVLGGVLQRVRSDRLGRRGSGRAVRQPVGGLARLDAAHEALQPLLLLVVELAHAAALATGATVLGFAPCSYSSRKASTSRR